MKEELQGKLVEILTSIQMAAGKASDFAMEQLPDIAQSYVAYGRAITSLGMFVAVLLVAFGVYCMYWVNQHDAKGQRAYEAAIAAMAPAGQNYRPVFRHEFPREMDYFPLQYLPFVAAVLLFGFSVNKFMLVWFAPKVWLLKEIATLIK
jgi:hypothetical protein